MAGRAMATDAGFVQFVCDQIHGAGSITYRRMFGEYALYADGKVVALLCDNQFFLKPTEAGRALLPAPKDGFPYPGARPHWLLDEALEDRDWLSALVTATARDLPPPKPKSASARRSKPARRKVQRG
jgi:TfoX/Sxy family transcriptional regulator of competence genes